MASSWLSGSVSDVTPEGFQPPVQRVSVLPTDLKPRMAVPPGSAVVRRPGEPAPGPLLPAYMPPPAVEPPTEAEARSALAGAQQAKRDAEAAVAASEAAYGRASRHLADCLDTAASYDSLDAEIATHTANALRSGKVLLQDEALRTRVIQRDQAYAALGAARAAEATLSAELSAAKASLTTATDRHEGALRNVLFCEAGRIAERFVELKKEADNLAATAAGVWASLAVRGVIHQRQGQLAPPPALREAEVHAKDKTAAVAQWRLAAEALRADPSAVVEIKVEDVQPPPAPERHKPPPELRR